MTGTAAALCVLITVIAAGALAEPAASQLAERIIGIPRLNDTRIDGDLNDWGDRGYRINMLSTLDGHAKPKYDFDPAVRLGWNNEGILAAVTVFDDVPLEGRSQGDLWQYDSIELFLARQRGDKTFCQSVIAPGMDGEHGEIRMRMIGHGDLKDKDADLPPARAARRKIPGGYTMEVLPPWKSLGICPTSGDEVGLQFWMTDCDSLDQETIETPWYPGDKTPKDPTMMYRVRLADKPSPAETLRRAHGEFRLERLDVLITVVASDDQAGKPVSLRQEGKVVAEGKLAPDESGRVMLRTVLPARYGQSHTAVDVLVDGQAIETVPLGDIEQCRLEALVRATPVARSSVFFGRLPPVEFDQPMWMEGLIGPYEIKTTWYDKDYQIVQTAAKPGRYGGVAEIRTQDGLVHRRFLTAFRMAKPVGLDQPRMRSQVTLAEQIGVRPEALALQPAAIDAFLNRLLEQDVNRSSEAAVLLAGLQELPPGMPQDDYWSKPEMLDRIWWLGLKRRLYGWDKRFPEPLTAPQPIDTPAPVIREGTAREAGMKTDAAASIDAILTAWNKDTDEAFAVCIARHGVIVLHKAYGTRNGKPMTVTTPSYMTSVTKMLSATCMMMAVDQGRFRLDDTIGPHLPPLAGCPNSQSITIRQLYNHTSGMPNWYWGDSVNDWEERLTDVLPQMQAGKQYRYSNIDGALGCKILEAVSGETLPAFFRKHLLVPLGCENTTVSTAAWDACSVPLDIARISQMLLNKGAYGKMRFMRPETFEQMLPRELPGIVGADGQPIVHGVGMYFFDQDGLGKGTFGHGGRSGVTVRIDAEHDLVIVMTRNAPGTNFNTYFQRFIGAVMAGLADSPTSTGMVADR